MAQDQILLELVSPEKLLLSRRVDMVVVPGEDGNFGVLPRHAPLFSTLRHGVVSLYDGGAVSEKIFVSGGFAEVTGARCTLLAEYLQPLDALNRESVQKDLEQARDHLSQVRDDDAARAAAQAIVERTEALLHALH